MVDSGRLPAAMQQWLKEYNSMLEMLVQTGFKPTPATARDGLATLTRMMVTDHPDVDLVLDGAIDAESHDIPVRIYHPERQKALPVLVYFHGGGGIAGSVDVYDPICRKMALACNHLLVSVDYRLAPENPYPCGLLDARTAVEKIWIFLEQMEILYNPRLSIGGDSGGGGISASVAHLTQHDPDVRIARQVLIYPSLDYTMAHNSVLGVGYKYLLNKERIEWYLQQYFQNDEDRRACSPLYMNYGRELPETFVITAEFCPLKDEGQAYFEKLQKVGIAAKHLHYDDMIHAFLNLENLAPSQCWTFYGEMGLFLNR